MSSTLEPGTNPEAPSQTDPAPITEEAAAEDVAAAETAAEPGADPAGQPAGGPAPEDPGVRRRRGLKQSVRDMVFTMIVIFGIVGVIVLALPRPNSMPQRVVDVTLAAKGAEARLGFVPAVPVVPAGWTATSADVRNSGDGIKTWHIGYLTADGRYASVEQAAKVTDRWVEILTSGGTTKDPQTIDGTVWEQRYKDVRDVYSLIHSGTGRTTMVTSKGGGLANAAILARSIPVSLR